MNKHMRFVVSVLFAVILLLTAAITKFYSDTGKSLNEGQSKSSIEKKLGSDADGNRIFEDSSGLYGMIDSSDRIIVNPEWIELSFAGNNFCIASKRLNGKLMTGCIDYEGNIVVPLVYRDVIPYKCGNGSFFIASLAADSSSVVYDENFRPLFSRSWEECSVSGSELTLHDDGNEYVYSFGDDGLVLKSASLNGSALDCGFTMNVYSKQLLDSLTPEMLEQICASAESYIEFAFTGSSEHLTDIRTSEDPVFTTLFPNEKKILSKKLTGITNMIIYKTEIKDEAPRYAVTITVDTEIAYSDSKDNPQTMKGEYKAVVEFVGSDSSDLTVTSGNFLSPVPDYPETQPSNGKGNGGSGT